MTIARAPETALTPEAVLDGLLGYISVTNEDDPQDCMASIRAMKRMLDRAAARLEAGNVLLH